MGSMEATRGKQRRVSRHLGGAAAALLFLAGSAPSHAARHDSGDPEFRALFLEMQQGDAPKQDDVAIPSSLPVERANLTSGFGVRADPFRESAAMHTGIDLAAPLGTPVYATADGVVDRSEWNDGGYGNLIEIDHGAGIQTRYGHLSERIAQPGQRVHRGELIGLMGSTGRSTGSHVHYEVRVAGRAVDPIPYVPGGATMMARLEQRQSLAEGGPRVRLPITLPSPAGE